MKSDIAIDILTGVWINGMGNKSGYQVTINNNSEHQAVLVGCPRSEDPQQFINNQLPDGILSIHWVMHGSTVQVPANTVRLYNGEGERSRRRSTTITASAVTSKPPNPPATATNAKIPASVNAEVKKRRAETTKTSNTPSIPKLLMLKDVINKRAGKTSHFNSKGVDTSFFVSGMGIIVEYGNKSLRAIIIEPIFGLQGITKLSVKYMVDNDNYGGKESTINVDKVTMFDEHYEGNIVPDCVLHKDGDHYVIAFAGYDCVNHADDYTDRFSRDDDNYVYYKDMICEWENNQNRKLHAKSSISNNDTTNKRPLSPAINDEEHQSSHHKSVSDYQHQSVPTYTLEETFLSNPPTLREPNKWLLSTPQINNLEGNNGLHLARGSSSLLHAFGSGLGNLFSGVGSHLASIVRSGNHNHSSLQQNNNNDGLVFTSAPTSGEELYSVHIA